MGEKRIYLKHQARKVLYINAKSTWRRYNLGATMNESNIWRREVKCIARTHCYKHIEHMHRMRYDGALHKTRHES